MTKRIEKVVGHSATKVWAGTFHSIFARILRYEADKIGYPHNFTIYDTEDTNNVIKAIIKEMRLNKEKYTVAHMRKQISSCKTQLITPKAYADDPNYLAKDGKHGRPRFHELYAKYTARCKNSGAMDFDDLLYRMYELLQNNVDEVSNKYREKFKFVLVDEFQDTNLLQYAIVKKLVKYPDSSQNVCIVGDDAQSIYAFRGATIENILNFQEDFPKANIYKLEQNYRSTEPIVQAANEVITRNIKQIPKVIWSDKGSGEKIRVIKTKDGFEEGRRVIDAILEQKNRYHLKNKEIAILYRTNAQSKTFEDQLRKHRIDYRIYGGISFYQRKEVKDLIAYMRLAINQNDGEALRRVINYPRRGIGIKTVDKVSDLAGEKSISMWNALSHVDVGPRAQNAIADFKKMIHTFQKKAEQEDAYTAANFIMRQCGLIDTINKEYGSSSIEAGARLDNLSNLMNGVAEFTEGKDISMQVPENERNLSSFLQSIALYTGLDDKENDNVVSLMSVHSAKGLEFTSVFVVGLEERLFPSFLSMDSREAIDEERRLFYVAITRAEKHLTLSYAKQRNRFGKITFSDKSRFVKELPEEHLNIERPDNVFAEPSGRSRVSGNFRRRTTPVRKMFADPSTFKPSDSSLIKEGHKVLHINFGEGEVTQIDGNGDSRMAVIFFSNLDDGVEKRIMLKYAKLQIVE